MDITIDASVWKGTRDFYEALFAALGAPDWHGDSIDALIDSMIWGGINAVDPPYKIQIVNTAGLPSETVDHIKLALFHIADARKEFRNREGHDVEVQMEIVGDADH